MKSIAAVLLFILTFVSAFSQCKDNSLTSSPAVIEKMALLQDEYKAKHYKDAKKPLNWLLTNAPSISTSLYIMGAETYDELAKSEQNAKTKRIYIDSLMLVYDLRLKNCGEEANVTNRKALSFFYYNYNDEVRSKDVLPLMDKAIELNGDKILDALAENYMKAVKISADKKMPAETEILNRYDKITAIIDAKIKKAAIEGKGIDRYNKMHDDNFGILSSLVKINCDFVRKKLGPEFKEKPTDLKLAKQIFNFMLKDKCTDDPLWLRAAETLHASEKDFGLAKILGLRYLSLKEEEKSAKLLNEALQLAPTASDKAEILGLLAHLEQVNNNPVKARELYLKAVATDPGKKEFYSRIGDLYLNSYEDCAKGNHQAEDRLVFLAAYDMYQKAGETQKMANAKSSFPSREEIFELNYKPGDKIVVACWINEETTIRTRN
jgi:tetratricopeptide (TPR) repeat protein